MKACPRCGRSVWSAFDPNRCLNCPDPSIDVLPLLRAPTRRERLRWSLASARSWLGWKFVHLAELVLGHPVD